jgi:integrase
MEDEGKNGNEKGKKRRRPQGSGSIFWDKDSERWVGVLDLGTVRGQRIRKKVVGRTKREVQQKLDRLKKEQSMGRDLSLDQQTVAEFLDYWLQHTVRRRNTQRTYESYSQIVRLYIAPALGDRKLDQLEPEHVQMLVSSMEQDDLSPRTIAYTIAVLRAALNKARKLRRVLFNVATLVDVPRQEKPDLNVLDEEQAQHLLRTASGDRLVGLYWIAIGLGLRQGELLRLRWNDIDFDKRTLTVRKSKSPAGERTLALFDTIVMVLLLHQELQQHERSLQGDNWQDHGLVFPAPSGKPMQPRAVWGHFKKLLKKAGLPDMRFHDLRHSCASILISRGIHMRTVMDIMGHSQISVTMNTYGHISPKTQRSALDDMEDALGGGNNNE